MFSGKHISANMYPITVKKVIRVVYYCKIIPYYVTYSSD